MDDLQIENLAEEKVVLDELLSELTESEYVEQKLNAYEEVFEQQQQQINLLNRELEQFKQQQQQVNLLSQELDSLRSAKTSLKSTPIRWREIWLNFSKYFTSIHGSSTYQPRFSLSQILFSYFGSFLGIAALAYLSIVSNYPLIAAPFGAAAVLVFAVPNSPLAQPRNLIFGNLVGGVVSLLMVYLFGSEPWVMALSVATAIKVMQLTKTLHPPGGAVALVGVMSEADIKFLFTPVLLGSIILLFCTLAFNNLMPNRSYPRHWL